MMKTTDGLHYAYNAQTEVDEGSQVVLATEVTNQAADVGALASMVAAMTAWLEAAGIEGAPTVVLADAGYCSEANLAWIDDNEHNVLVATGRIKAGQGGRTGGRLPPRPDPCPCDQTGADGPATSDQVRSGRLRQTQGHRRAGLRPDEGQTGRRTSTAAGADRGRGRVDVARHLPRPPQVGGSVHPGTPRSRMKTLTALAGRCQAPTSKHRDWEPACKLHSPDRRTAHR